MNVRFLPTLERPLSPDLQYIACPDCGSIVHISMMMLDTEGHMYMVGCCHECADMRSIKGRYKVDADLWASLVEAGLPVFEVRYED